MRSLITYVPDLTGFKERCATVVNTDNHPLSVLFESDENGKSRLKLKSIGVHKNGNESLTLIQITGEQLVYLELFSAIRIIGECINDRYIFNSNKDKKTYERVRGPLLAEYTDENGDIQTYNKPYMIGVFA
tara:strand:+ start:137 stop:529 length:393 start_codon:yes stop_codon:yes gene_type:complete